MYQKCIKKIISWFLLEENKKKEINKQENAANGKAAKLPDKSNVYMSLYEEVFFSSSLQSDHWI